MGEYVTKSAYEKMKGKLEELKSRRQKISKTIGEAREHGDLRENSAYHAAKEEQGLNEMRIRELEQRISSAVIADDNNQANDGVVKLGCTVKIKALDNGDEMEYTLVPEIEADIFENKISLDSPVGAALMNGRKGEVVEVEVPRGIVKYEILEVKL